MAHVGMKYPVAAKWNEDGTYETGFVVGKAIQFTGTPNKNDVELYADDGVAETDKSIKDLGTSLNVDDITLKVQAELLGHEYEEASEGKPERMVVGTDDVAPYFGMGFYKRRKKNNVVSYTGIWLYKVQNSEPNEEAQTKGDTTDFQTPTVEGKAYPTPVGENGENAVMEKVVYTTEKEVIAWLKEKAQIGGKLASEEVLVNQ